MNSTATTALTTSHHWAQIQFLEAKAKAEPTETKRYDNFPDTCPNCGSDGGPYALDPFHSVVRNLTGFPQFPGEFQFDGPLPGDEGYPLPPNASDPVTVYCEDCDAFLPITGAFAENLIADCVSES